MKGLFNLEGLDSKNNDELLSANICESGVEFGSNCPASNPEVDFDKDATSGKETSIPVPGGDKETPTAKPEGGEKEIPVPGGDKETPTAKPYDAASIPVPSKVVLTSDQYNNAISNLKKSFKEGVELMEMLEGAQIIESTIEDSQLEFTESIIEEALMESYCNGPLFEAVKNNKKEEIKKAAKTIMGLIKKDRKEGKTENNLREATWTARLFGNNKSLGRNAWKNVGTFMAPSTAKANTFLNKLRKQYSEILGDLTLNYDVLCDFKELSKNEDINVKDKKDLEEAAKTKGNLYMIYVDSDEREATTLKVKDLNKVVSKLK